MFRHIYLAQSNDPPRDNKEYASNEDSDQYERQPGLLGLHAPNLTIIVFVLNTTGGLNQTKSFFMMIAQFLRFCAVSQTCVYTMYTVTYY